MITNNHSGHIHLILTDMLSFGVVTVVDRTLVWHSEIILTLDNMIVRCSFIRLVVAAEGLTPDRADSPLLRVQILFGSHIILLVKSLCHFSDTTFTHDIVWTATESIPMRELLRTLPRYLRR